MKIIGLTGGIGSGKTTVAKMLEDIGTPIFIADLEAKRLMATSKIIKRNLIKSFGKDAFIDNKLNRPYLARIVFNDKEKLNELNGIVHPKVHQSFKRWCKRQKSPYAIYEAAIIFELDRQDEFFKIILVTADMNLRINRLKNRDDTTQKAIKDRMKNQWDDDRKIKLADYIIDNDNLENTRLQVEKIHYQIIKEISE